MNPALIVFAKAPVAGEVKTRLTSHVSPAEAARLYAAFLEDSLHQYVRLPVDLRLYVTPPASGLDGLDVPSGISRHVQNGDDLGARMSRAFVETFAAGYERIAIVGTDHPTLPPAFIGQALEALAEPRSVVIGPASDGGYYLLALNDFIPQLFAGIRFSHGSVFVETLRRAAESGAAVTVLPAWYDVDDAESLLRLALELSADAGPAPRTAAVLRELARQYDWLPS